jgi:predicted HAD superfamily Cof-like phosphohydrolase
MTRDEILAADVEAATSPMAMVREFHEAFGLPVNDGTRTLNTLRAKLIREEAREAADAIEAGAPEHWAQELADLVYVAYGAALTLGIDLDRAVQLVHASNMSKLGPDGRPIMREDGKVLKGPNYRAPDMGEAILDDWDQEGQDYARRVKNEAECQWEMERRVNGQ